MNPGGGCRIDGSINQSINGFSGSERVEWPGNDQLTQEQVNNSMTEALLGVITFYLLNFDTLSLNVQRVGC